MEENCMVKGKKGIMVAGVSALLLMATVAAFFDRYRHEGDSEEHSASVKTLQRLSSAGGDSTDPKELIRAELDAAAQRVSEAAAKRSTFRYAADDDLMVTRARKDCRELFQYAASDLRRSRDQFPSFDHHPTMADVKTWVSAAVTFHETCIDGFDNTAGSAGENMRMELNASAELTKNGLAMVDQYSSMLDSNQIRSRRLLHSGPEPIWIDPMRRTLLEEMKPDLVVAQDGRGDARTINEALIRIPKNNEKPFVLYVKQGVYAEEVRFDLTMKNLVLIGDGPRKTKITGSKSYGDGFPTFQTPTVAVVGENFSAKNIGFENTAGALKHQAVALRVQADKAIFHNCQIDGYQDTLYVHAYRQFYRDCTISGTIDFIFGDGSAVFQNCKLVVRRAAEGQSCVVTAQGRTDYKQPTGIVLQNCTIVPDPMYPTLHNQKKAYLGRPWKVFSRTVVMDSFIDAFIDPAGWMPWKDDFGTRSCFYAEFNNRGPGAGKAARVTWRGVKNIDAYQARGFAPGRFLDGDAWVAPAGVPYFSGMTPSQRAALQSLGDLPQEPETAVFGKALAAAPTPA